MQADVTLTSNKITNIKLYRYLRPETGLLQAKNYIEGLAGEEGYTVQVIDVLITPKSIRQYLKDNGIPEQTVRVSGFGTRDPLTLDGDPLTMDGWRAREQELIDEIKLLRTAAKQQAFDREAYTLAARERDEAEADLRDAAEKNRDLEAEIFSLREEIIVLKAKTGSTGGKPAPFLIMYDGQTMRVWENLQS